MSNETKRDTWRWFINLLASVLTALAAALGTTSCVSSLTADPSATDSEVTVQADDSTNVIDVAAR